ncbi:MAG: Asp/Glu racemase [Pseudomonadota bacterium]
MTPFPYALAPPPPARLGLVLLQADETLEQDLRRLLPPQAACFVSRVPSGLAVTPQTLAAMETRLAAAAALLPRGAPFDALAYACTSGSAAIGSARVAARLREGAEARATTDPVAALAAACRALGLNRLALLSPYIAPVSESLRRALAAESIETPVFGTFAEAEEARVARIDGPSIRAAAGSIVEHAPEPVDALFLSCTNLRTLDLVAPLEAELGLPVLSSNLVLAWHLLTLASAPAAADVPGRLFAEAPPAVAPKAAE